ncbi:D-alanyl-D-alanine carboxypeptidase family protein [Parablautia intestinalis]|uniref:D-alanyl-D-alanine carboxypeptidase family protein n=1 Tax=Parablautia intestinalis TaxID=2320100 RepID=UPI0023C4FBB6|nr:D-alanyl-D-alanine carboxypeptidase family protein [Parablautia intestinalis]MCI8616322.1 D-alanyl-D-alanine carboxypeptidase [Lachnospiraceae bacterium]MDE7047991.1 D-alanyl-D-alanine carboxypeptidase [Lachnospiraceae bacterium]
MCFIFLLAMPLKVDAAPAVEAPSYILMESSTGQIICEQNADERRSPASITKIMTLLVIFDHIGTGRVQLDSEVMTSAYAKSMGGSQVFLEEGEIQTLDTIIKCIAVASGNDASVAAAEFIAGSEQEFVNLMNQRAEDMGLTNTHFEDCCGLSESDNHYTSAKDVALMSRELITKYPQILDYTKIWMEDITHVTRQGTSNFTLSSTNKLLKMYDFTTGLKTGSTSKALYCLSATANKDNIDLIAVVMASPSNKSRFQDAMTLLNYGYSVSALYEDANEETLPTIPVKGGVQDEAALIFKGPFRYLDIAGSDLNSIEKTISLSPLLTAPVNRGDAVGEAVYTLNGQRIGSVSILSDVTIDKAGYKDILKKVWGLYCSL